jgi:hypothetical protein
VGQQLPVNFESDEPSTQSVCKTKFAEKPSMKTFTQRRSCRRTVAAPPPAAAGKRGKLVHKRSLQKPIAQEVCRNLLHTKFANGALESTGLVRLPRSIDRAHKALMSMMAFTVLHEFK